MSQAKPKSVFTLTSQLAEIRTTLKQELGEVYDEKIEPVRGALRQAALEKPLMEILQQTIDGMLAKEANDIELMTLIAAGLDVLEEAHETRH